MTAMGSFTVSRLWAALPRVAAGALIGVCVAVLIALGALWWRDRTRVWETPVWNDATFTRIDRAVRESAAALDPERETWVVAVNPDCGHCDQSLRNAGLVAARRGDVARLEALIVDRKSRPSPSVFGNGRLDAVWWDERQVWRGRWGHRVYGEVLRFDAGGRCLGTWPPEQVERDVPDP
jgi:hypothetical protein